MNRVEQILTDAGWQKNAKDYWSFEGCPSMSLRDAWELYEATK